MVRWSDDGFLKVHLTIGFHAGANALSVTRASPFDGLYSIRLIELAKRIMRRGMHKAIFKTSAVVAVLAAVNATPAPVQARYLQVDPVGYEDQVNLYSYVMNDPINKIDFSGEKAGDLFYTPIDAAADVIRSINGTSIIQNREYGGTIRKNADGLYYATEPVSGKGTNVPISFKKSEASSVYGDYHTHGNYSKVGRSGNPEPTTPSRDAYNSDHFSSRPSGPPADMQNSAYLRTVTGNGDYRSYLGTPSGNIMMYNPATSTESQLNGPFMGPATQAPPPPPDLNKICNGSSYISC